MNRCDMQADGAIELYFYGELEAAQQSRVAQHLPGCASCREALEEMAVIRAALAARPDVSAPREGDWTSFMARLDAAVAQERPPSRFGASARQAPPSRFGASARQAVAPASALTRLGAASVRTRLRAGALRRGRPSYVGYFAMAALLALVTMSVLFVARSREATIVPDSAQRTADAGQRTAASGPRPADPQLASMSERHLERSKLVVLGMATKDAAQSTGWQYERELAGGLLNDTRLYRLTAEQHGMTRLAGVLRDLEIVLLQTSLVDEKDPAALQQIQRLIDKRDLVEQMETVTTESN